MFRRLKQKRISGHRFIYHDKQTNYDFFFKVNKLYDISILAFGIDYGTYREFVIDYPIMKAIYFSAKHPEVELNKVADDVFINSEVGTTQIIADYISEGFTLLAMNGDNRLANVATLAQVMSLGTGCKTLVARRVVYKKDGLVLGIDTLALPLEASMAIVNQYNKTFVDATKFFEEEK